MSSEGIKAKVVTKGRQYDTNAKRYMFYPLSNLDFAASQFSSPIWNPKFPKGRIVLLESTEYKTQVYDEGEETTGSNGVSLGERIIGTDAQVKFLMGNTDGSGYMDKGMTHFDILVDVDPETVSEIERLIFGDTKIPENLIKFREYLSTVHFDSQSPVAELAKQVQEAMLESVNRSINWCRVYTNQIEQEVKDGQAGGIGIKFLSETNKYYFYQIEKPLPEDRAGSNMGKELAAVLAPLIQGQGLQAPTSTLAADIEKDELQRKLDAAEAIIKEQGEALESLNEPEVTEDES